MNHLEMATLLALTWGGAPRTPTPIQRSVKQCLECGKKHDHNNSWCSAQCCKLYRAKEKYQRLGKTLN